MLLGYYFFDSLPVDVFRVTPGAEDEVEALQALQAEGREDAFAHNQQPRARALTHARTMRET